MSSLKSMGRAILLESGLPQQFYGRALAHAADIQNMLVHPLLRTVTPAREQWPTHKLEQPIVFGSAAYRTIWPETARGS
jgi:hypothetical protein